ncbi:AAA domain-containing protein [Archangium gephyra]|nr:AAA domain-containing protein [Archangium gephyra]
MRWRRICTACFGKRDSRTLKSVQPQVLEDLNASLAGVDPSSTSPRKYDPLRKWIAELLGAELEYTYATTVSGGTQNLRGRFRQSGRTWHLGVVVIRTEEDVSRIVNGARSIVGPSETRLVEALVVCVKPDTGLPSIEALVEGEGGRFEVPFKGAFPLSKVERPFPVEAGEAPPELPVHRSPEEVLTDAEVAELAGIIGADREWVDDVRWSLRDKKAIVFYGPPGTGKTFIARKLAEKLQPNEARRAFVQLHPSYGYEDFFEGYRPSATGSGIALEKRSGPLRRLVELAEEAEDQPVVLVLDEMNRGNLPKVFGELYFLLEYRDESVSLMYSPDEQFRLPPNFFIIGSMNTADRSIVLLDQALRRRFFFVPLFPGEPPVRDLLRRYLEKNVPAMEWVARLLERANEKLGDRNLAIGPSHFMRKDLNEEVLARIWKYAILPTLEDLFFGEPQRLEDFSLERLAAEVRGQGA